ncbi:MAG: hypothetical protein PQJ46_12810 [Spirochaetales bacterium]|nr:hypothetical protein [Spirochaetales bacterium]
MAIVKMKKVSLVLFDKYREESLKKLRELGVMHLEKLEGKGEEYDRLYSQSETLKNAAAMLNVEKGMNQTDFVSIEDSLKKADEINAELERAKALTDKINAARKEIERIEPVGQFDPCLAEKLAEKMLPVTVYGATKSDVSVFKEKKAFCIAETKAKNYYAFVGEVPEECKSFERFDMPEKSLKDLEADIQEAEKELKVSSEKIVKLAANKKALLKAVDEIGANIDFEIVRSGINIHEKVAYLSGFCPEPAIEDLKKTASQDGWALLIDEPAVEDEVPTQLKLGKFASLLEPVTNFLGILPGYREYDISFFFLCFFSVFTAMLIGDAGYGFLFLVVTFVGMILSKKKTGEVSKIFFLLLLLSVTTMIYGAISGTWFASKSIMEIDIFQKMKIDAFKVDDDAQISLVMGISFFLGIVQLLIGVVQNFKKNFPKLSSFAQIGWFAILASIYYLVIILVVRRDDLSTFPKEMMYVLLGGVVMVFIFGAQEEGKSFIQGILASCANFLQLFLDVVGTFSDIMSYVRLFAVGLASVKIAETFNQLGGQMSHGPIIIFGILIVILGHSINIVLGLMAILVHAVRLNILEYSGRVGVEWSGFKYEPFKNNKEN